MANKVVCGIQCTICWYVDNTKISHEDSTVVDWVIQQIEHNFGKMTVKRGKKHTFVGVDIEFSNDQTVKLSVNNFVEECISVYGSEVKKSAATPAKGNLFEDNEGDDTIRLCRRACSSVLKLNISITQI